MYGKAFSLGRGWLVTELVPVLVYNFMLDTGVLIYRPQTSASNCKLVFQPHRGKY